MQYAALALVLSEKRDRQALWQKALEDFNVIESPFLREIRSEGRKAEREQMQRSLRNSLTTTLKEKYGLPELPPDLKDRVEQQADTDELMRWLQSAAIKATLDEFRAAISTPATNGASH